MRNYDNFINGKFAPSTGRERITCINPSTGAAICTVPDSTAQDVEAAIAAASAAQKAWARRPAVERGLALRAITTKIRENVEPLARLITEEQGKTLGLARVEVAFTADYMDYMAEWARRIEGEILESDRPGETILLFRQAIGVIDRKSTRLNSSHLVISYAVFSLKEKRNDEYGSAKQSVSVERRQQGIVDSFQVLPSYLHADLVFFHIGAPPPSLPLYPFQRLSF